MVRVERFFCLPLVFALTAAGCSKDGSEIYARLADSVGGRGGGGGNPDPGSGGTGPGTPGGSGGTAPTAGSGGAGGSAPAAGAGGGGMTTVDAATSGGTDTGPAPSPVDLIGTPFKMLVFTKAVAFVHDSIPACVQMLRDLSGPNKFTMTETADAAAFTDTNLKQYDVVFFVNTTGGIFSDAIPAAVGVTAKAALQKYMESGGGYAGVHAATDCERDGRWPWYEEFMGALWSGVHDPDGTPGTVVLQPVDNPAVRGLPTTWIRPNGEEWYRQTRALDGRAGVTILAKLASDQRPVSWIHELPGGGRMFYTIQGHAIGYYAEDTFRKHVLGGLLWAAKRAR